MRLKAGKPINALLTLCLIFPWTLNAQKTARISLPEQFARLGYEPIELQRTAENHLFLFGKLNGRRRSVLVDSGWSFTTVSTNAARKLPSSRGGGTNEPPSVLIEELKLGRNSFSNQLTRVERMVFDGQATPFEVVLGCDFLRRHFAVIDCLNQRLYVRSSAPTEQEQIKLEGILRANGFEAVALDLKNPLAITCPARVNDQPVEMLVDTGAVWSTLDVRQLDRLGLRALPTLAKISGVGRTGTRGVAVGEAESFALGDVRMKDANFALMDLSDWGLAAPGKELSEVQGILGGAELLANGALIDCHRLKLWVKRGGGNGIRIVTQPAR
ncbi:MAG: pepsin/retropepsin-like aspartic protease family protein [Verrucomicrobiota bacterium]